MRYLSILFLFLSTSVYSQETSSVTTQLWFDINLINLNIDNQIGFYSKFGYKNINPKDWEKYYSTIEFHYDFSNLVFKKLDLRESIHIGSDFYLIDNFDGPNSIELAPYQGYSLIYPEFDKSLFKHVVELGQRFQWTQNENMSFGVLLSYKLDWTYKFKGEMFKSSKGLFLTASMKFWWNLKKTIVYNDVFRVTPGIGYDFNEKWVTTFLVGYNYTKDQPSSMFQTNNIIYRFRLYYKL